jgi:hypothetical protein
MVKNMLSYANKSFGNFLLKSTKRFNENLRVFAVEPGMGVEPT